MAQEQGTKDHFGLALLGIAISGWGFSVLPELAMTYLFLRMECEKLFWFH